MAFPVINQTHQNTTWTESAHLSTSVVLSLTSQACIAVANFFANSLIMAAIIRMRSRRTSIHLWMFHLAMADAAMGVALIVRFVMELTSVQSETLCKVLMVLTVASIECSMSGLLAMSVRAYLVIGSMARAGTHTAPSGLPTMLQCGAIWCLWLAYTIVSCTIPSRQNRVTLGTGCHISNGMFDANLLFGLCVILFLSILVIAAFQFGVLYRVRKHTHHMLSSGVLTKPDSAKPRHQSAWSSKTRDDISITRDEPSHEGKHVATDSCVEMTHFECHVNERKISSIDSIISGKKAAGNSRGGTRAAYDARVRQMMRLATLTTFVVVLFIVCWLPIGILLTVYAFCSTAEHCPVDEKMILTSAAVMSLHSLVNAIIYAAKSREFRRYFKRSLCCGTRSHSGETADHSTDTGQSQ